MSTRKEPPEPAEAEREPAKPIGYSLWERRADRRHGIRDGRNRIPSLAEVLEILEAPGPARMPTPYLEMLFSRARDMMEHERLWYIASTVSIRSQLAALEGRASAARAALAPAEELRVKAHAEITDEDLLARHSTEELRTENFIRLRREAEREQRIAAAEAHYLRMLALVHDIELEITHVRDTVQSKLSIARMRALRISAYLSARTATYWEGLVHTHRDGRHLAPLLPHLIPRLPQWVVPEEFESPESTPLTQPLTGTGSPPTTESDASLRGQREVSTSDTVDDTVNPPLVRSPDTKTPHVASAGPAHQTQAAGGADGQGQEPEEQPVPSYRQ
jgi:hypothetical protein